MAAKVCMTEDVISDSLDKLRGAIMIVYPMNLPPYDPIRLEFEGQEDLTGSQVLQYTMSKYVLLLIAIGIFGCSRGTNCSALVGWKRTD